MRLLELKGQALLAISPNCRDFRKLPFRELDLWTAVVRQGSIFLLASRPLNMQAQ
ncbi:hypothetical protein [Pseudomonas chlororaphis]|uniref:hypothetical protein n=1 Tax=Pseudomonas chlororaphis TaxID=587753 RepID=UPI000F6D343B|nr:hypothetical protein [Pseudomonas chlororaphis]AZD52693.1 hypothetical protein C4K19_0884 [Pseudomonas chlororaphis subsp. aurantiaca]AZD58813.1 hypothetical protein C4K18_0818 [Pseudomonas chlororaphis subsp. aurantiaca]